MSNRDIALEYLRCFCAGDVDALTGLLSPNLQLTGPLYRFESRDAYLSSLRDSPPGKCDCRILSVTEAENQVSVFYEYEKPDGTVTIAQLFEFANGKISTLRLVFDASPWRRG